MVDKTVDVRDPDEGVDPNGCIRTGARAERIAGPFRSVIDRAVKEVGDAEPKAWLAVYGSVATGRAVAPTSDVDLLSVGIERPQAEFISASLSAEFRHVCRSVDVAAGRFDDYHAPTDEGHGNRVFLRHYCVTIAGRPPLENDAPFPADARAARGFNGDIAQHAVRWADAVDSADPAELGRRVARKTLLAVAGLVSVRDRTWTTDRTSACHRWSEIEPGLSDDLAELLDWSDGRRRATRSTVERQLAGPIDTVVQHFDSLIGLWT